MAELEELEEQLADSIRWVAPLPLTSTRPSQHQPAWHTADLLWTSCTILRGKAYGRAAGWLQLARAPRGTPVRTTPAYGKEAAPRSVCSLQGRNWPATSGGREGGQAAEEEAAARLRRRVRR